MERCTARDVSLLTTKQAQRSVSRSAAIRSLLLVPSIRVLVSHCHRKAEGVQYFRNYVFVDAVFLQLFTELLTRHC